MHAATADRAARPPTPAAERALWRWAQEAAADADGLTRLFRTTLVTERKARLRARAASRPPSALPAHRSRPEALLEIIPRGWEPGRYDWRVCVVPESGEVECVEEEFRGTGLPELPGRLSEPLAEAFRRCDGAGYPAALQLAVPGVPGGLRRRRLAARARRGAAGRGRPVVVRRTDPAAATTLPAAEERHGRWLTLHRQRPRPAVLDCDEGAAEPGARTRANCAPARATRCRCCAAAQPRRPRRCTVSSAAATASRCGAGSRWTRRRCAPTSTAASPRTVTRRARRRTAARRAGRACAPRSPTAYRRRTGPRGLTLLYDDPTRPLPGNRRAAGDSMRGTRYRGE